MGTRLRTVRQSKEISVKSPDVTGLVPQDHSESKTLIIHYKEKRPYVSKLTQRNMTGVSTAT